jgi:hypothetical protein
MLERCPPNRPCVVAEPTSVDVHFAYARLSSAGDPVGTVYRATSEGQVTTSLPWRGPITNLSAPTVNGLVAVGSRPQPVAGSWAGGWGAGEVDNLSLRACKLASGRDCESLPDRCAIPSAYEGRWLAVVDRRSDPIITAAAERSYDRSVPDFAVSPNHVMTVVGQIGPGPNTRDCRSPRGQWLPFARLKRMRYAGYGSRLIGGVPRRVVARGRLSVQLLRGLCLPSCSAEVRVSRGKRSATRLTTLVPSSRTVTFSSRALRRVAGRPGRAITVRLRAGDSAAISKRVRVDF